LHRTVVEVNALQDGQSKGRSLATARLRLTDDISTSKQSGNCRNLNRGGLRVAKLSNHGDQGIRE
jgi:hypothetical protein